MKPVFALAAVVAASCAYLPCAARAAESPAPPTAVAFPIARQSGPLNNVKSGGNFSIEVGRERIVSFPALILSATFLDGEIVGLRAVDPHALAIQGKKTGRTNLVLWLSTKPGDKVGQPLSLAVTFTAPGFPDPENQPHGVSIAAIPELSIQKGLARLLSFPKDVIAVFFTDSKIVTARALNPRTIVVTGKAPGNAIVTVQTKRYPGDKVGAVNRYNITVKGETGDSVKADAGPASSDVDTRFIAQMLGRTWPDGDVSFEAMLEEEIQKRDARIKELEGELTEKRSPDGK